MDEGLPKIPTPRELYPEPEEVIPSREEVVEGGKEFFLETVPQPKDIASAGRELASSTVMDKAKMIAVIAGPPAALLGSGIVALTIIMTSTGGQSS